MLQIARSQVGTDVDALAQVLDIYQDSRTMELSVLQKKFEQELCPTEQGIKALRQAIVWMRLGV